MNNRLKAWIGFNDGKCDDDTQMLIDDIKELESRSEKQEELITELVAVVVRYNTNFLHYKSDLPDSWHEIYNQSKTVIERYKSREKE
jgi:uncharacterized coiled-coil protein SlyX